MHFGQRLKELREAQQLSQTDLAAREVIMMTSENLKSSLINSSASSNFGKAGSRASLQVLINLNEEPGLDISIIRDTLKDLFDEVMRRALGPFYEG